MKHSLFYMIISRGKGVDTEILSFVEGEKVERSSRKKYLMKLWIKTNESIMQKLTEMEPPAKISKHETLFFMKMCGAWV